MSYDPGDYHALIRKTLKKKKKGRREQVIKKNTNWISFVLRRQKF